MIKKILLSSVLFISMSSFGYTMDPPRSLQNEAINKMPLPPEVKNKIQRAEAEAIGQAIIEMRKDVNFHNLDAVATHLKALSYLIMNYNKIPNVNTTIGKTQQELYKQFRKVYYGAGASRVRNLQELGNKLRDYMH